MALNRTPRTWVPGLKVLAQHLNDEVKDLWEGLQSPWDTAAWVPGAAGVWTAATTNPTIGNGTSVGQFQRYGRTCFFSGRILPGSSTTFGSGTYNIGLPVAAPGTNLVLGSALLIKSGGNFYVGVCYRTGTGFQVRFDGTTTGMSPTVPVTFANGDGLYFAGQYQTS